VQEIYNNYTIYHQAGGTEQNIFDGKSDQFSARSSYLIERFCSRLALPLQGRLLDVGCGNGSFLRSFHQHLPNWKLNGLEVSDKYKKDVEGIEGVEKFYSCLAQDVPGMFDVISMVHVLEHVPFPKEIVATLHRKLKAGGLLLIQVPNYLKNPFDLLIADHCTHFTLASARDLLLMGNFDVLIAAADWIPKELTIIGRKSERVHNGVWKKTRPSTEKSLMQCMRWLKSVAAMGRKLSMGNKKFGLFGTSIAAVWLFQELRGNVQFFVDEDPHRVGKEFMGRPVYAPASVPDDGHVLMAFPRTIALKIAKKVTVEPRRFSCHAPPPF
jgi:SAM-dependent methyltransferase